MSDHDLEKLLGGYATGTLTPDERQRLYQAALHDQTLFNALADEQALKELLEDPIARRQVVAALQTTRSSETQPSWATLFDWFRRPANLAWAGGLATLVLAVVLGQRIYQENLRLQPKTIATEETPRLQPSAPGAPSPTDQSAPRPSEHPLIEKEGKQSTQLGDKPVGPSVSALPKSKPEQPPSAPAPAIRPLLKEQITAADAPLPTPATNELQKMPPAPVQEEGGKGGALLPSRETVTAQPVAPRTMSGKMEDLAAPLGPTPTAPESREDLLKSSRLALSAAAPATGPGARELFYAAMSEPPAEPAPRGRRQVEAPLQTESDLQARGERKESTAEHRTLKSFGAAERSRRALPPLGLRYSLLIQGPGGSELEVAPDSPLGEGSEPILSLETNQGGYLYVWKGAGPGERTLVFPPEALRAISEPVLIRTRYRIPLGPLGSMSSAVAQPRLLILYSRLPLRDPRAPAIKPDERLLTERVSPSQHGAPAEQAVYVATADPSPSARLAVEIALTTR
jgi:hypothetical protein